MFYALSILLESAWTASIIPMSREPTFFALHAFGNANMGLPFFLAVIGATAGQSFNWLIGRLLLKYKSKLTIEEHWYNRAATWFNHYGLWLLLFSWMPLCNLLLVLAGFVNARFRLVLLMVIIGQAAHYGWYLL